MEARNTTQITRRPARAALGFVLRLLDWFLAPRVHLRHLALATVIQILTATARRLYEAQRRRLPAVRRQAAASSFAEWTAAQDEIDAAKPEGPLPGGALMWQQLEERAGNYRSLQSQGDEYGLMFHLRSELMRRQVGGIGGAGFSRDSSSFLRLGQSVEARRRLEQYQQAVIAALRYVGGARSDASELHPAQRLAFINETRHAFGRTALLLSGGGAMGVKHLGVVSALLEEKLLPKIVSGTSAGSIVAAVVGTKRDAEVIDLVRSGGAHALIRRLTFFGLRRGESQKSLVDAATRAEAYPAEGGGGGGASGGRSSPAPVEWSPWRGHRHVQKAGTLLDNSVLSHSVQDLVGDMTFLEAFDRTGRVLNIVVTRSDGKAPPMMCNYLTTPQLLVCSATCASCAIPGVFKAVELIAKGRDGALRPYFPTRYGWRFTDGGLQADLPKQRLSELFNVNQYLVSQVNPLAPLFMLRTADLWPAHGADFVGFSLLDDALAFCKRQLVAFVGGLSQLGDGTLTRPFGFRGIDLMLQDYEGTVTISPHWDHTDLIEFISNFDDARVARYIRDGEAAAWPQIRTIRDLCEIEFALDDVAREISKEIQREVNSASRENMRTAAGGAGGGDGGGGVVKVPSYIDMRAYGGPVVQRRGSKNASRNASGDRIPSLQPVASHASLLSLAGVLADEYDDNRDEHYD